MEGFNRGFNYGWDWESNCKCVEFSRFLEGCRHSNCFVRSIFNHEIMYQQSLSNNLTKIGHNHCRVDSSVGRYEF